MLSTLRTLDGHLELCAVNTATLGHRQSIESTIELIARRGFGGISIWRSDIYDLNLRELKKRIQDAGLQVSGYCRSVGATALDEDEFKRNIEENRRAIIEASEIGAGCFHMVAGGLPTNSRNLDGARGQFVDAMTELLEFAESVGVALAIEPLNPMYASDRSVFVTLEQSLDLCDLLDPYGSRLLGVTVDVWHCWWDPKLVKQIARATGRRLLAFHVCDWSPNLKDWVLDRQMMGDGVVNIRGFRESMEASGYSKLVEVEIFSKMNWWQKDPAHVLDICAERLQSLC